MEKNKYQIEFADTSDVVEAINPEEAFIKAVRRSKLSDMSSLFRFRMLGTFKREEKKWKYQDPLPILKKYNLIHPS